jgi:hypothetical protein
VNDCTPSRTLRLLLIAGALGAMSLPLIAQDAPPKADPPADPPKQSEPEKEQPAKPADAPTNTETEGGAEADPPASDPLDLDDLLRLPGSQDPVDRADPEAGEPETELDRRLTGRQAQQALVQAVQEMGEVADRLDQLRDAGVVTQRLQQEIITKLDVLIESAESQQSQSSSSSSSSQQQGQQQPGQQQTQQNQQSQTPGQSSTPGESMPPGRQGEQLNQNLDLSVAEWGNLPERLRQSLIQGQSDYFSDLYRRWTESYYRRLAEEASR